MRSRESTMVSAFEKPCPSPAYTWCHGRAGVRRSRRAVAPPRAAPPCRRRPAARAGHGDLVRGATGDRRGTLVGAGQRTDEAVEVAGLEAVRGGGEVEEIGHAVEAHHHVHDRRRLRGHQQRGEPARAPADHRDARRVGPALAPAARIPAAVSATSTIAPSGRAVPIAGRSRWSPGSSGAAPPTPRHEVPHPRLPVDAAWPVGPPCTSTSSGGAGGRPGPPASASGGATAARAPLAVAARPRDRGGLGRSTASSSAGAPRARAVRAPVRGSGP